MPGRILVVDDNQAAADGLVKLLRALGEDAFAVYTGADARTQVEGTEVELAFIDIGMPDMNGLELIALLRSDGFIAPAIALSGYGLEEDKRNAVNAGFTAHLTKPIGIAEIKETLATYGRCE